MNDKILGLYHRLPTPLRAFAANIYGYHLRSWRYGPQTAQLVEEALEREHWSWERWKTWQEERLAYTLHRAATKVPYYREQWAARRRRGDRTSWRYLENWPILEKEPLRQNPTAFVADDCDIRRMYHDHTSGTTGTPLDVWLSRHTVRGWYALLEARLRHWNGVSRDQRWAILGGQPIIPPERCRPPFWVWNTPMNQLYLSTNHISRQNVPAYVEVLTRYCTTHMVTYSSCASVLAREVTALGLGMPGFKVIITNAEPLFPWQREAIQQAFGCQVRETYGMAEIVTAASECSNGILHLWPEVGWLEVLDDQENTAVPPGSPGRLVSTGLLNTDMPLIRYVIGDRGRLTTEHGTCQCGRRLPALSSIEGRNNDLFTTSNGRYVYVALSAILSGLSVCEAQIIQETPEKVLMRYVYSQELNAETRQTIIERLRARLGAVEVSLEQVDEIPRSSNGKFRAVICNLSLDHRTSLWQASSPTTMPF
jgi:phenylacetate-CoA ligase